VNWLTVAAQIVNFLILVWLLKKLLYERIIKAMDAREAKIASRLTDAAEQKTQAESEAEGLRRKQAELDANREEMLAKAKADAEAHRAELVKQARAEAEALQARWRESIERQQAAFRQDLRERATKQTFAVARRTLADLAGAELEARILDVFLERLAALPADQWAALAPPPADEEQPRVLVVRSVFELPDDRRQRLEGLVRDHMADGVELRFETAFDPVCGIELRGEGRKVAWSIDHYLNTLEESLAEAFEQRPSDAAVQAQIDRDVERDEEEKPPGEEKKEEEEQKTGEDVEDEDDDEDEDERGNE